MQHIYTAKIIHELNPIVSIKNAGAYALHMYCIRTSAKGRTLADVRGPFGSTHRYAGAGLSTRKAKQVVEPKTNCSEVLSHKRHTETRKQLGATRNGHYNLVKAKQVSISNSAYATHSVTERWLQYRYQEASRVS